MRCLSQGGPRGMAECGDDELQMPAVQKILNLLALYVGDDLIE